MSIWQEKMARAKYRQIDTDPGANSAVSANRSETPSEAKPIGAIVTIGARVIPPIVPVVSSDDELLALLAQTAWGCAGATPVAGRNAAGATDAEYGYVQPTLADAAITARIELPLEAVAMIASPPLRDRVRAELRLLGFRFVTVDLDGFRSGSLNLNSSLPVLP